jgi:PUL domain
MRLVLAVLSTWTPVCCTYRRRTDTKHGQSQQCCVLHIAATGRGSLAESIDILGKLARWPSPQLFPVLDIFRLLVQNRSNAQLLSADAGELEVCETACCALCHVCQVC